jgi:putative tricarboxylic transport membrane protein
MDILQPLSHYFQALLHILSDPVSLAIMFGSVLLGIIFGALPGLTSTLGVALLTAITYGLDAPTAMVCLLSIYVGGTYGGSYSSILINIPGTAASAATALDGYPLALKGEAGRAIGLSTTSSAIGTIISMLFLVTVSPIILHFALQFTSFEFFLLAFFGILISGTLTTPDLVSKGWIAGFLGLFLACVGRDRLQFFPRFTFGYPDLDGGIEVVPVLIGAFGIPQIIQVLKGKLQVKDLQRIQRIVPDFGTVLKNIPITIRSALIGVGVGVVPGIGEDIAAWVSYGTAKNTSKHPERFGKGEITAVLSTETANNACVGGAIIPLLNLGIPGSPPAAMLLGALMLHGVAPGPMITFEHPKFILQCGAILFLASMTMWIEGMTLAKQVVKVLRIPAPIFMPIVGLLCIIGSYSLGLDITNLYLMLPVGIICYFLTEMGYPIAPLVIGVILGPMADENLRRALMVSKGSFWPVFTRPVSLALLIIIAWMVLIQIPFVKQWKNRLFRWVLRKRPPKEGADAK